MSNAGDSHRSRAIGVFDSGVGGLTVLRALRGRLPAENTLYLGDTARLPYGPKSSDTIRRYTAEAGHFLVTQGIKLLVIACNTATSRAGSFLAERLKIPVVGVVEPGAAEAAAGSRNGVIGVIGTRGTIESGSYERAIQAVRPEAQVHSQACPLFVALAEEGWTKGDIARLAARRYLEPLLAKQIDTLVLGCTHYPLLKALIAEVVGPEVVLVDSAEATASAVALLLQKLDLTRAGDDGEASYFVTDDAERFRLLAGRIMGQSINHLEKVDLEGC